MCWSARALIGILLNAMTIIDIPLLYQNLIKAAILLGAIIVDGMHQSARRADRAAGRHLDCTRTVMPTGRQ